jgi:hypothetical protein
LSARFRRLLSPDTRAHTAIKIQSSIATRFHRTEEPSNSGPDEVFATSRGLHRPGADDGPAEAAPPPTLYCVRTMYTRPYGSVAAEPSAFWIVMVPEPAVAMK